MDAILKKVLARIESQDKRLAAIESTIKKLSAVVTKISDDGNTQRGLVQALNDSLAKIKAHLAEDDITEEVTEASDITCNRPECPFIFFLKALLRHAFLSAYAASGNRGEQ